jgi:hypothetical protein
LCRTAQKWQNETRSQAYLDTVPVSPVERPLVELPDGLEFLFLIRIKEAQNFIQNVSDFNLYSTPPTILKKYGSGMKYMLDGDPTQLPLEPSLIDQVRPQVFTYTFRGRSLISPFPPYTGLVNIDIVDENSNPVFSFTSVASDPQTGLYTLPLDFSDEANGIYTITATKVVGGAVVHEAELYIDNALAREDFFGLVRLRYADSDDLYNGVKTYTYAVPNRKVRWRYYISVKEYPGGFFPTNYLQIADTLAAYTFTPSNPPGEPHPLFKINGLDTIVITSTGGGPFTDGRIPYTEKAIRSFRLTQQGTMVKTLVDGLPNGAVAGGDSNNLNSPEIDVPPYAEIFLTIDKLTLT